MQISTAEHASLTAAIESVTGSNPAPGAVTDALITALLPALGGIIADRLVTQQKSVLTEVREVRRNLNQQLRDMEDARTAQIASLADEIAHAAAPIKPGA